MDIFAILKWVPAVKAYVSEIYSSDTYPSAGRTKNRLTPVVSTLVSVILVGLGWYIYEKVNLIETSSEVRLQQDRIQAQLLEQTEKYNELRKIYEKVAAQVETESSKARTLQITLEDKDRELADLRTEVVQMDQDLAILTNDNARMEAELRKRKLCTSTPTPAKKPGIGADIYMELSGESK
jgi:hypothetical protein